MTWNVSLHDDEIILEFAPIAGQGPKVIISIEPNDMGYAIRHPRKGYLPGSCNLRENFAGAIAEIRSALSSDHRGGENV